ncbi:MAG TPA: hypothetical protein VFH88_07990, partial [Candidatus Krumholzibacteria bacterium]|nr:hypothetical protein [Candidatus Krumholzibacteria bacterium]
AGDGGLKVIDISNPASPTVTGSTTGSDQNAVDVALAGDYAVVANSQYGVAMVDISGPTPGVVATLSAPGLASRVAADGNYAYVTAGTETNVMDITDPVHPAFVAGVAARGGPRWVTVHDNRLYVSDIRAGVQVVDVSTPADPHVLGYLDVPPLPDTRGVVVDAGRAYIAAGASGLAIADLSKPPCPNNAGGVFIATRGSTAAVAVDGDRGVSLDYVGLNVLDISDPSRPTIIAESGKLGASWYGVALADGFAYALEGSEGMLVFDVTDLINPHIVGHLDLPATPRDVVVLGNRGYLADGSAGLHVVDVSDPTSPRIVGTADTPYVAAGVAVNNGFAYVADGNSLQVVDVRVPTSPRVIGGVDTPGLATDVCVVGDDVYLANGAVGLQVINVSHPTAPRVVRTIALTFAPLKIAQRAGMVYLVGTDGSLQAFDILRPERPADAGRIMLLNGIYDVAVGASGVLVGSGPFSVTLPAACR